MLSTRSRQAREAGKAVACSGSNHGRGIGPRLQWSLEDADPEEDAFERTARSVGELYSEALASLEVHGPRSEMCLFIGHDPDVAEVKVSVSTDTSGSYESAGVRLPSGVARLPASERQLLVLEIVHGAVLRLAEARGWDLELLGDVRSHVLEADFEFRWDGPWKTSPDRRHRARARYRLPDSGYGRAWIEVTTRNGDPVVESASALAFNTSDSFRRSAATLRWDGSSAVQLIPYNGASRSAVHGLVRLEHQQTGWMSFADDGMNAGTLAAELSANPPTDGSGAPHCGTASCAGSASSRCWPCSRSGRWPRCCGAV